MPSQKQATLYRMVLPDHECPFGVQAKALLEEHGYLIDEHVLSTRGDVDAFEADNGVTTTPQIFIDGERVGGTDELEVYLSRS
jgi:glutaredoxin 3